MVRCPKTGREFNSGYRTNGGDLAAVPSAYSIRIRCPLCKETHAVMLSQAREVPERSRKIAAGPDKSPRDRVVSRA